MNKDLNPNKVRKNEVDEVFMSQVTESLRKKKNYLQRTQAERERDLAKAEAIVKRAQEKKKKKS